MAHFDESPSDEASQGIKDPLALSKRAARRLIQRAFVLAGRERSVRQHIREARGNVLWMIEDWNLAWTIVFEKGGLEFDRRPAKHPDFTLSWATAEEFFAEAATERRSGPGPKRTGLIDFWKYIQPVHNAFFVALREVLQNPVDEDGTRLA